MTTSKGFFSLEPLTGISARGLPVSSWVCLAFLSTANTVNFISSKDKLSFLAIFSVNSDLNSKLHWTFLYQHFFFFFLMWGKNETITDGLIGKSRATEQQRFIPSLVYEWSECL